MIARRHITRILAVVVIALTAGIVSSVVVMTGRKSQPENVQSLNPSTPSTEAVLSDVRFEDVKDGRPVWVLLARRAEYDKAAENAFLDSLEMTFFKSGSSGDINVEALKGTYAAATRNILLTQKVFIQTESGMEFETDELAYDAKALKFTSAKPVSFSHGRLELHASGMVFSANDQKVRFHGNVKAVIKGMKPGS